MKTREVFVNKRLHKVKILERNGNSFLVEVNDKTVNVRVQSPNLENTAMIEIDGRPFRPHIERTRRNVLQVKFAGKLFEVQHERETPKAPAIEKKFAAPKIRKPTINMTVEKNSVVAPIAGRIALLKCSVGQRVRKGECICILEAMKMENEIVAPRTGVVRDIRITQGAIVRKGDVLAIVS